MDTHKIQFEIGANVEMWHPFEERKVLAKIVEINTYSWSPVKYWFEFDVSPGPSMWLDYKYDGSWSRYQR